VLDPIRSIIKEPGAEDAGHYARRVVRLAILYCALFVGSLAGIALLVWRAQLLVTLAQRSNVETLTLAFFLVFFGYLAILSAPGLSGALHIARLSLGGTWAAQQQRKMAALGRPRDAETIADMNAVLELAARPGEDFDIVVADAVGRMGVVHVRGARLAYAAEHRDGSNEVLAYFVRQVARIVGSTGTGLIDLDVVAWQKIDDEDANRYHGMVEFARNLSRALATGPLWPTVSLTDGHPEQLTRHMSEICPALRNEGFLPNWDYQAEHKLPLIPEPLGLLSLSRSEQRIDPVSSIGCAVFIVLGALVMLAILIAFPPWVPGT